MTTLTVAGQETINLTNPGQYLVQLTQSGAEVSLVGVFQAANQEQTAVEVIIHHQAPHTRANTTLKAVARDQAAVKLTGRIIIDQNCSNSNSFLTERVLLLSDQARAETIPDLEILSDDVKCSHAASISSISPEQLFYLQSRGLSADQATALIVEGFLA